MANFPHALNTDSNVRLTNGIWDDNVAEWMIKVQNYVMSSGGIIWVPDSLDVDGNKKVSIKNSVLPTGAATQTTLANILTKILTAPATEAKQDTMIAALNSLKGYSDGLEALMTSMNGYVDGLEGYVDGLEAKEDALAALVGAAVESPAAYTMNARLKSLLTGIVLAPGANLIGKMGIDQTSPGNTNAISMISSIESVVAAPVVGVKSVTTIAAEIFAGGSVKTNRRKLVIRNEDPVLRLRIGPSSVTQQNGFPIEPGATAIIKFDPATAVPVYGISEGAALNIAVWEV